MNQIKIYEDVFKIYELVESNTNSWVKVCPERGAIITSFGSFGEEKLYLDKDTFYDINANIRGGIPVLFPICSRLENMQYTLDGETYTMKNHGLARISSWEVIETGTEDSAFIKLSFKSNEETKKSYPFDFEVIYTYILKDGKLSIEQEYINNSEKEMPFYAGFHPYFKSDRKELNYESDATKFLDENDGEVKEFNRVLDLNNYVESPILLDANKKLIAFKPVSNEKGIVLTYGEDFKYVVLWSVKGKDFVCVEPWTAIANAMNTKNDLLYVKKGESYKTFFDIDVER
ncbi:MAG: aldose epimerase [Clostridiaceae bacterium]